MAGMAASPHCYFYTLLFSCSFSLSFAEVLKEAAIPAIVSCSPHKQAENSMTGCCNNLPWTCHIAHLCG
jgi:hypothetical protein